jgi:Zn-dependent peptidase ImmA (M78 family)
VNFKTYYNLITEKKNNTAIDRFVKFACKYLKIKEEPTINFITNLDKIKELEALGGFDITNNEITIVKRKRLTDDILRTLAHELVHLKQHNKKKLKTKDGKDGSKIENEANVEAGIIMRKFRKIEPSIMLE